MRLVIAKFLLIFLRPYNFSVGHRNFCLGRALFGGGRCEERKGGKGKRRKGKKEGLADALNVLCSLKPQVYEIPNNILFIKYLRH